MSHSARALQVAAAAAAHKSSLLRSAAKPAGISLPVEQRETYESRLGADFSSVRIHSDAHAAASADALGAKAFAAGPNIFFAANRYQPSSEEGRTLLAHELVHVAQQTRGGTGSHEAAEGRADAAGESAAAGESVSAAEQGSAEAGVYCEDDPKKLKLDDSPLLPPRTGFGYQPPKFNLVPPLTLGGSGPSLTPPTLTPPPGLAPGYGAGSGPLAPYASSPGGGFSPTVSPPSFSPFNAADTLGLFAAHGTTPGAMGFDVTSDFSRAYNNFSYLPPFAQKWSANHFLTGAYGAELARDNPNALDISNRDFAAAYPGEFHTPIIPLISPDTLPYITKGLGYAGEGLATAGRGIGSGFEFVGDKISELIGGKKKK